MELWQTISIGVSLFLFVLMIIVTIYVLNKRKDCGNQYFHVTEITECCDIKPTEEQQNGKYKFTLISLDYEGNTYGEKKNTYYQLEMHMHFDAADLSSEQPLRIKDSNDWKIIVDRAEGKLALQTAYHFEEFEKDTTVNVVLYPYIKSLKVSDVYLRNVDDRGDPTTGLLFDAADPAIRIVSGMNGS
jgi:hypothetical protein